MLFQPVAMPTLDNPFSMDETGLVLKEIPLDHALVPNGFNVFLMKNIGKQPNQISVDCLLNFVRENWTFKASMSHILF
jgi:hypothetical protein